MKVIEIVTWLQILVYLCNAVNLSLYNGKCVSCMIQNSQNYYCTKENVCSNQQLSGDSCDTGLSICLGYESNDLGVLEIPPFQYFEEEVTATIYDGQSVRFLISNQDPEVTAWYEVILQDLNSNTFNSTPSSLVMY